MNFTQRENIPGLIISIDFQKGVDMLEWNYLVCCLEAFNSGLVFIEWVKTFYKNIERCVINNEIMPDSLEF